MPADRLTHPRIGRSRKVTALNDFEFRVWDTYRWTADDFGVMPKVSEALRGSNDALRVQHTEADVAAALDRLVAIDLITEFDHQGTMYVCSLTWNRHQKIEHPRQTFHPAPPAEVIGRMDVTTRLLFRNFHEYFRKIPASRARARPKRLTANANAGANGSREGSGEGARAVLDDGVQRARFERFWQAYPRQVGKDAAWLEWRRRAPDEALTEVMIAKIGEQRRSRAWRKDNGDFIPKPTTWLTEGRWQDQSEITPPPDERESYPQPDWMEDYCCHRPCCETTEIHRAKRAAEKAAESSAPSVEPHP